MPGARDVSEHLRASFAQSATDAVRQQPNVIDPSSPGHYCSFSSIDQHLQLVIGCADVEGG